MLPERRRGVEFFNQQQVYVTLANIPRFHPVAGLGSLAYDFHVVVCVSAAQQLHSALR